VSIEIILILNIPIQSPLKINFRGEKDINCVKIDNPAI